MNNLVFHPTTERQLQLFIARPSHALILVGPEGAGKSATGRWLATRLLELPSLEIFDKYPYQTAVAPDGQSISIEAIRELIRFTKLKVVGSGNGIQRIAIVEQAQLLTTEAQNALLKLLEEPPADTMLLLTVTHDQALLPTIRSRAQVITVQTPAPEALTAHFADNGHSQTNIQRALLMSGGLPGLMSALLEQNEDHPLALAAQQARAILQADAFGRLTKVDALSKQKLEAARVLFMLGQMARVALARSAQNERNLARWHQVLQASYAAETSLQASAQPKLVLTNLMLQI